MRQALVIGDDPLAASMVEARLWEAGYTSVAHAFDDGDAWRAIAMRPPALIVFLALADKPLPVEALYRMSRAADAPVLVAGPEGRVALDVGDGASLEGPYALDRMAEAVAGQPAEAPLAACC